MRYLFGDCELDSERLTLIRSGQAVHLRPKAFQLLTYLLEHHQRMISKQELCEKMWPNQFISDSTLESTIRAVRRAIGDSGRTQQLIETRYRQGYCFVGTIDVATDDATVTAAVAEGATLAESPPLAVGERRVVTLLSCGLVHTESAVDLDTLHDRLLALYGQLESVAATYGGTLQALGDNQLLLVLGVPQAQEDHAERGVLAGLALLRALVDNEESVASVRLGVHTSEVAVGGLGTSDTVVGEGIGVTRAIQSSAAPGELVCSWVTAERVQDVVTLKSLAPLTVEGQPLARYRVIGRQIGRLSPRAVQSRFVGRAHELSTLDGLLDKVQQGRGQVVGVVGEPGIGKTRLVTEFHRRLAGRQVVYWQSHCPSYGVNSAFLLPITLLHGLWGLRPEATPAAMRAAIAARLSALSMSLSERMPYVLRLLDVPAEADLLDTVSAQAIRARTIDTLVQLILQQSERQPLILEIENLHWMDPSSEEVLSALVERLPPYPVLLLLTYRPGYRAPWGDKSYATQVSLSALSVQDSRHLVRGQLGAVPESVIDTLVARGSGNPLFLEELAHAVRGQDMSHVAASVPETVRTVVVSRLDRLSPKCKQMVQAASVIGDAVPTALLQAVTEADNSALANHLHRLQADELVFASRRDGDTLYHFKHKLVQEAVYHSLLQHSRCQYHARIAQCLIDTFPEALPEHVAHHYTEAGLSTEAIAYWQRAGQRAVESSAYAEAIRHCRQGLKLLQTLPATSVHLQHELALQTTLGPALIALKGQSAPEVSQAYSRARELCQQVGGTPELCRVLWGLRVFYLLRAELRTARELAEQALQVAQRHHDPDCLMMAHMVLGGTLFYLGEVSLALHHLEQGRAFGAPQLDQIRNAAYGRQESGASDLSYEATALWVLGYSDQAIQRSQEVLALAQELANPFILAIVLHWTARLHQFRREWQEVQAYGEALIALASEHGFAQWLAAGTRYRGRALVEQGQVEEGMAQIQQSLSVFQAMGSKLSEPCVLPMLAEAHAYLGQVNEGLHLLAKALSVVEQHAVRWMEAEVHRLKGELLLSLSPDNYTEAETCFHQALTVARRQQAKSWELRAATSLAHLWQSQGKRREAYDLLAPVYGWFTEGFDTADLKDANALLQELEE